MGTDWAAVRADFPVLRREIDGSPIVYLDSGNTSQKPNQVIDAMRDFQRTAYGPINRSAYRLAAEATDRYEGARSAVARLINAPAADEVVFTKNATEALNLVAGSWGGDNLGEGDVVVLTHMEHHANIVPWQMLAATRGVELRWVPLTDDGQLDLTDLDRLLDGAKAFAFTAMSNVLGTIPPVAKLCEAAHDAGALAIVDACQYVPHNPTDVRAWDADFVAFSAHKMCGPSGIGALWGRMELLDAMPPYLGGGNMIADVRLDGFTPAPVPAKFEAGTPPITEAVGFGAAAEYLESIGMAEIRRHEVELTRYAIDTLKERYGDDITIHGPDNVEVRGGVLSFAFRDIHPHDVSQVLDEKNVCVRAGHHCAKPLMRLLGANATTRASLYLYNDESDIDTLGDALDGATDIFGF
ncbi:MAG: SufS family cysteine desulfurase [Ilumatobacter sp.]|uniref:aminotransferase class V-fold PLP-dependent enzyme n=1 Tax=Ilumatobacter sp. TaxID=1967498 RepID=UPI0026178C61|nr:SufS family cysteine desulfurase [Ilumatobacter sp.]MDJ0768383.1 SufS family cysteine desulfurase [Ilumatobacter sp.]